MAKAKTTFIRGLLKQVTSQRLQYKPYGYELDFSTAQNLVGGGQANKQIIVEMEIPTDTVIEDADWCTVISLDGLNAILEVTADSLDKLDAAYKKKVKGG